MNDREAMRRETRNLRREVHESRQFADKLQKEKRDLSNEMDHLIRSRSERLDQDLPSPPKKSKRKHTNNIKLSIL